jgi:hypothetical protein
MTDPLTTQLETFASASSASARYSEAVAGLVANLPPSQLGPGTSADASLRQTLRATLAKLSDHDLFAPVVDSQAAACCRAGLWLGYDFLEESHSISQAIETSSGSYWHGIMHRREPDPDNAKYWFRRVRQHPVFAQLAAAAAQLANSRLAGAADAGSPSEPAAYLARQPVWDPFRFVDFCERTRGTGGDGEQLCRDIARLEWRLLFDHCHRQAKGLE